MADTKVSALTALAGGSVAANDALVIVDTSAVASMKILISELAIALSGVGAMATDAEVASAISALSATYQPLDADLTAIAAVTTTSYGRSLLAAADATALRTLSGAQDASTAATDAELATGLATKADLNQTLNAQTGTTYTLVLTDNGKLVTLSNAAAITATVPLNSSVAFPVGARVDAAQTGAGQVTFAPAGGVTLNGTPGLKARAQYSGASLVKTATDTWLVVGDLSA